MKNMTSSALGGGKSVQSALTKEKRGLGDNVCLPIKSMCNDCEKHDGEIPEYLIMINKVPSAVSQSIEVQ